MWKPQAPEWQSLLWDKCSQMTAGTLHSRGGGQEATSAICQHSQGRTAC